jgi:hypothetical protein
MNRAEIAAIFDKYDQGQDPTVLDEWLDSWLHECIDSRAASFAELPDVVRHVFAGRFIEWDVGNGGFAQATYNAPHLLEDARQCYLAIGREASAERIASAIQLLREGEGGFESTDIGELFSEFAASKLATLDNDLDEIGWWAKEDRVKYAAQHRAAFLALVPRMRD